MRALEVDLLGRDRLGKGEGSRTKRDTRTVSVSDEMRMITKMTHEKPRSRLAVPCKISVQVACQFAGFS